MFIKSRCFLVLAATAILVFAATEGAVISMAVSAFNRLGNAEDNALFDVDRVQRM